ncbi:MULTISPECIES: preprotein translocase subunit SecE [Lactobacillales]|uniref:Protein translocase subunit SecE n=1 Tax=Aerococcus sanguinicola TaxID=119206 RepID=A0A109RDF3_9LACT|nr:MULTISPECIES: preprotein translocase subunit SecE [Lactobacillales]AMB94103.1 preprotein translocase subunit SecE [Aerococcus sanguinicola]KAA9299645.1 preprotein translocase subunit SecE [Aerococcus sanguinicola]KAB0646655.1 preprotein translocase subunit SecE [Aerococcus sanguinicola]MCW1035015.1 preprotein translocase subunit SecE [Streptococcus anginosus]MDK6233921.1 preprotein translocase subunit SecE [Aerococcus sp. UMB10185]
MSFIKGVFHEMRMVEWPSGKQLMRDTGIVLITILIAAIYLGVVDELVTMLFGWFIQL